MQAAATLSCDVGKKPACEAMGVSRASFYRRIDADPKPINKRPPPPLALSPSERQAVIDELHNERFQDRAPLEIYASLLDEGRYLCSPRTMYRILSAEHNGVQERRGHVQRPHYTKPELLATAPNQVWSWDISALQQRRRQFLGSWPEAREAA